MVQGPGGAVTARPCGASPGGRNPTLTNTPHTPGTALPAQCPLFARKFSPFTADVLLALYQQDGGLGILDGMCNVSDLE
jgi:hypothetical protein